MARSFDEMMQGYSSFQEKEQQATGSSNNLQEEQLGFWGYLGDIAAAPFRGVEGAIQGVYNLADYMTFDALPDYDNRLLGKSSTMVGGIVEGISQFAIPFVGVGLGAASKIGALTKVSGVLTKAEKAAGAGRKAAAIAKGRELGKYAVAGAVTDFAVFDAHAARLSNLIQMAPSLQNPITEYLASDENDSEIEGRLKNAIEGLGIGGLVDTFIQGLRGFRHGLKAKSAGKSPDEVMQAVRDGVVDMKGYQKVVEVREYTSSVAKSLNIGEDQAVGVVTLIKSLGLDTKTIEFRRGEGDVATKGLVEFKEDGTAIITGFRNSDVSTGIHEVAHVARRWLLNRNLPEQARRGINEKDLDRIEKWAGVTEKGWGRGAEEKFARGFERYIREGKAPTKGLHGLFTKLGGWMRDVYEDVSGSQIDIEMNAEIKDIMGNLMTREGLPARPATGGVRSLSQGAEDTPRVSEGAARSLMEWSRPSEGVPFKEGSKPYDDAVKAESERLSGKGFSDDGTGTFVRPNLSAHGLEGNAVYHETSLTSARSIMKSLEYKRGIRMLDLDVSDNLDLALGQKGRGYILELDPRLLNGRVSPKLGAGVIEGGGREFVADKFLKGSLKAVIVPNEKAIQTLKNTGAKQSGGPAFLPTKYLDFDNVTKVERGYRIPRKPHKRFQGESDPSILRQSDDEFYDLGKEMDEVRAVSEEEALKTPKQRAAELKAAEAAGRDPESVVGGKVNAGKIHTEAGVIKLVARFARELEDAERVSLGEAAGAGRPELKEALDVATKFLGDTTGDYTLHHATRDVELSEEVLVSALAKAGGIRNALKKLAADLYEVARLGDGAGLDDVLLFVRMKQVHGVYLKASVNMGRNIARALAGRRLVDYIDPDVRVMPEELVTGGKGEGLGPGKGVGEGEGKGPGKGSGEGEGLGPGKGAGEGEGKGPGKGEGYGGKKIKGTVLKPGERELVDWSRAQRQVIEEIGEGNFEQGLKRVRAEMNKFAIAYKADQTGAGALKLLRKKNNALVSYWMNAILSGPSTHFVNIASGLATTLFLPLEKAIGRAISERSLSAMGEELSTYMYLFESFGDAMGAARMSFKEGKNRLDPNVRAMEYQPKGGATDINPDVDDLATVAKKWAGKTINAPSRFLTAEDEFFKQLNYRAHIKRDLWKRVGSDPSLRGNRVAQATEVDRLFEQMVKDDQMYSEKVLLERAHADATMKGLDESSKEYNDHVKKYLYKNWDQNAGEIAERAREVARASTFTTPLSRDRGMVVGVSRGVNDIINKYPSLRFIIPFVRTPTNLLKFYLDRSPIALKDLLNKEFRKSLSSDAAVRADFMGRFATGAMGLFGMVALAKGEILTGSGPSNKYERDALMRTGWQPHSIKIGENYVSYRRLDPFATFLGLAADFNETMAAAAEANDEEATYQLEGLIPAIAIAVGKNVASKSYLTGLQRVFGAVSNPAQGGPALAEQFAASFIPAFVGQTGPAFGDGDLKEINGMLQAIQNRFPKWSDRLDRRRNFLGQTIKHPGQGELYNPFTYSTGGSSLVAKEIANVGHGFTPPGAVKNGVDLRDYENRKAQSAYDRWLELHGSVKIAGRSIEQELTRLFKSHQYKRLPAEDIEGLDKSPRVGAINRVVSKYRAKAFSQMLKEFPEVQQRDEIGALIKQHRRSGNTSQVNHLLALIERQ